MSICLEIFFFNQASHQICFIWIKCILKLQLSVFKHAGNPKLMPPILFEERRKIRRSYYFGFLFPKIQIFIIRYLEFMDFD